MNNKTNLDVFDESTFVNNPSVPFGQVIEDKLGTSGVVTLQVLMGGVLAYWYYGASQEFALVVMVLAMTAIAVTRDVIKSVFSSSLCGGQRLFEKCKAALIEYWEIIAMAAAIRHMRLTNLLAQEIGGAVHRKLNNKNEKGE